MTITRVGILQSVQVGTPQRYLTASATDGMEHSWETSFFRVPSAQPQADTKNHGQLSQAILLYAAAHYPIWQAELNRPEIGPGGFGENFTVDGLTEATACIGDIYAIGEAQIQVTGPRYPCGKIERRWDIEGLTTRVAETGRTGWFCRVVREGMVEPGMFVTLIERPYPEWTLKIY